MLINVLEIDSRTNIFLPTAMVGTDNKISNSEIFCGGFFNIQSASNVNGVVPCKTIFSYFSQSAEPKTNLTAN
jgi:hypothetical protein